MGAPAFGPHPLLQDIRMKLLSTTTLGVIGLTLAAGPAMAQISPADRAFAIKAAAGGLGEVALGQLATRIADDTKVRRFGERMVTDHTQANQELQQIATQQRLALPTRTDAASDAAAQQLKAMTSPVFDTNYVQDMIQDHRQDIADFRLEADSGQDPALRGFARKYLPILQHHLQMAEAAMPK
jgi:putative membrane protein